MSRVRKYGRTRNNFEIKYTNGKEYIDIDGNEYTGFYILMTNGIAYEGVERSSKGFDKQLTKAPLSSFDPNNKQYYNLTYNEFFKHTEIEPFYPRPSAKNYKEGKIKRYFVKKINQNYIAEINQKTFQRINGINRKGLNQNLYSVYTLEWNITGPIQSSRKVNARILDNAEKYFKGIRNFLGNLDEFHPDVPLLKPIISKNFIQEDLYTSGNEFMYVNGTEYIGSYHVHPLKGPMVGSKHSDQPHEYLYPMLQNEQ